MIALTGHYRANCAVLAVPEANARAMLTTDCVLDQQPLTPVGTHPIILLMGEHSEVRLRWLPGSFAYREALVSVPWVRHRGKPCGSGSLAHVARLWLDRLPPVVGGWVFGFPKNWNPIEMTDELYSVGSLVGRRRLLDATFAAKGSPAPVAKFDYFAAIRPIFEEPFLQRLVLFGPTCVEIMDFGLDRALLQPITADVRIHKSLMTGLPPGLLKLGSIEESPFGAFRLDLSWTLTAPMTCQAASAVARRPQESPP